MTIHLPPEIESQVNAAVAAGLYPSVDEAMTRAALLLLRQQPRPKPAPAKAAPPKAKKPLTVAELHQQMLADGLISRLPDPSLDIDDDDEPPIVIEGEPLSETIIRERR